MARKNVAPNPTEIALRSGAEGLARTISEPNSNLANKPDLKKSVLSQLNLVLDSISSYKDQDREKGLVDAFSAFEKSTFNAELFYQHSKGRAHVGGALSNAAHASDVMAKSLLEVGETKAAKQTLVQAAVQHMHSATANEQRHYGNGEKMLEFVLPELIASGESFRKAGFLDMASKAYTKALNLLFTTAKTVRFEECMIQISHVLGKLDNVSLSLEPSKSEQFAKWLTEYGDHMVQTSVAGRRYIEAIAYYASFENIIKQTSSPELRNSLMQSTRGSYMKMINAAIDQRDFGDAIQLYITGLGLLSGDQNGEGIQLKEKLFYRYGSAIFKAEMSEADVGNAIVSIRSTSKYMSDLLENPSVTFALKRNDAKGVSAMMEIFLRDYHDRFVRFAVDQAVDNPKIPIKDAWMISVQVANVADLWHYDNLKSQIYEEFGKKCADTGMSGLKMGRGNPLDNVELLKHSAMALIRLKKHSEARTMIMRAKLLYAEKDKRVTLASLERKITSERHLDDEADQVLKKLKVEGLEEGEKE